MASCQQYEEKLPCPQGQIVRVSCLAHPHLSMGVVDGKKVRILEVTQVCMCSLLQFYVSIQIFYFDFLIWVIIALVRSLTLFIYRPGSKRGLIKLLFFSKRKITTRYVIGFQIEWLNDWLVVDDMKYCVVLCSWSTFIRLSRALVPMRKIPTRYYWSIFIIEWWVFRLNEHMAVDDMKYCVVWWQLALDDIRKVDTWTESQGEGCWSHISRANANDGKVWTAVESCDGIKIMLRPIVLGNSNQLWKIETLTTK